MKRLSLFVLLAVALSAASCANVYEASSEQPEPVNDILLLEPVSVIQFMTDEELVVIDDDLSRESSEMIGNFIMSQPGYWHVTDDAILLGRATEDLVGFYNIIRPLRKKLVPTLGIPDSINDIIKASGHRYGMAIVSGGFTRSRRNYTREVVRDVAVAILSLGSVIPVTYKNMFDSAIIIFDSQTNSVVYFRQLDPMNFDSLNQPRVYNYLSRLISRYKWLR